MMTSRLLCLALALLAPAAAYADRDELAVTVSPQGKLLWRDGSTHFGAAAELRAVYGLRDALGIEASLACDRFGSLRRTGVVLNHVTADVTYAATRCSVVPAASFQLGARYVAGLALGLGYRFEARSGQRFVTATGQPIDTLPNETAHQLLAALRASFGYRVGDQLSLAAAVGWARTLAGGHDQELTGAFSFSFTWYP